MENVTLKEYFEAKLETINATIEGNNKRYSERFEAQDKTFVDWIDYFYCTDICYSGGGDCRSSVYGYRLYLDVDG
ncbi:MAG: hypothetical protein WC412_08335 [Candidatus Omnitrophota bacterium]|jgi:hypothetical protein